MAMKKNIIEFIKWMSIICVVVIAGLLIYFALYPNPPPQKIDAYTVIGIFVILIGISFVIHGFHPLLLVQCDSDSHNTHEVNDEKSN